MHAPNPQGILEAEAGTEEKTHGVQRGSPIGEDLTPEEIVSVRLGLDLEGADDGNECPLDFPDPGRVLPIGQGVPLLAGIVQAGLPAGLGDFLHEPGASARFRAFIVAIIHAANGLLLGIPQHRLLRGGVGRAP